jgi:prevent-host-death family protein
MNTISVNNMLDSIVPISRFNKGEASKIFDEVDKTGVKIVVKNNIPTGIILSPEKYKELMEEIEDYHLYMEAEKRMSNTKNNKCTSQKDLMDELGISQEDLDSVNVEIE